MKKSIRKWIFWMVHLLGFVLLWFVVRDLEWDRFFELLKTFPAWKYLTGLGILCIVYAIKSFRWYLLNRSFGIKTTWTTALIYYLSAGFLSVITPGRLGEFAKIYFLERKYGIGIPAATSSVILDRIWDVLILSLAAAVSAVLLLADQGPDLLTLIFTGALFLLSLAVILAPSVIFFPLLLVFRRFESVHGKLEDVFRLWNENRFNNFISSLVISAVAFLLLAFIPMLFSMDTMYPISWESGIGAISISNILSFIPVTIAGFGTRELVFVKVWELSGYPREIALSVSTAYFMVTYLGSLIIGGVIYLTNLKHLYRIREIRKINED